MAGQSHGQKEKHRMATKVLQDAWTGTRGHTGGNLSHDWDEALNQVRASCSSHESQDDLNLPPAVALRVWDFLKKNFPDQACAVVELYLES